VPLIVYSDQTNVTVVGNKKFHPVYMTVGNISQEKRKQELAWRLLGYIPILDEEFEGTQEASKNLRTQLFQASLKLMLQSATNFSTT